MRDLILQENCKIAYSLKWDKCTKTTRARIEVKAGFKEVSSTPNFLGLIKNIKAIMFKFEEHQNPFCALYGVK